jgi:hypothetical protein
MTCVNKAQWQLAIEVIETIKDLSISARRKMPHRHFFRKNIMQLNSLFRSLLAAYACGASGSGAEESN